MIKRISLASAILVLAVLLGTLWPAPVAAQHYYVSLGTSLAEGFQPNGVSNEGYADQLFTILQRTTPDLQLVKLGCGGETTTVMINGGGLCSYPLGSQLKEAEAFLQAHRGAVTLVTIDAGSDDIIAACPSLPSMPLDAQCINDTFTTIETNLPTILARLRQAAGPTVPIVGTTYYDLFLAFWVLGGEGGQAFALDTYGMFLRFNDTLERIYKAARSPVADVEGAFSTTNFKMVQTPDFGSIPLNVARICQWTWMCEPPPLGPDIHANTEGHGVIAEAFHKVLPKVLP
jgi:lysophospholipase L1-like esterase